MSILIFFDLEIDSPKFFRLMRILIIHKKHKFFFFKFYYFYLLVINGKNYLTFELKRLNLILNFYDYLIITHVDKTRRLSDFSWILTGKVC